MSRSVGTKGYTIQFFINLFTNTTSRQLTRHGVYNVVSPRFNYSSVRAEVLDNLLNNQTSNVFNGVGSFASLGKTPRARLINALRTRKATGSI